MICIDSLSSILITSSIGFCDERRCRVPNGAEYFTCVKTLADSLRENSQLKIEIDETGSVTVAKIICGGGILADISREAALKWRFKPTLLNGQPVKVRGILTFNFTLQ